MSKLDTYFSNLLNHLFTISNLGYNEKNEYWIELYNNAEQFLNNNDLKNLHNIMILIHPDFLYDNQGEFIGDHIGYNDRSFNLGINESDICQINKISEKSICQFNSYKNIRGKCQADHYWPYSLGGPSIFENRILLCKYHNVAKSNSILEDFWKTYPDWINDYIERMYNFKK